jgi:hypothetical protein
VATLFILFAVWQESDVVLTVVTSCLLSVILLAWLSTLVCIIICRRNMKVILDLSSQGYKLVAKDPANLHIKTTNVYLLPFFSLELTIGWNEGSVKSPKLYLNSLWLNPLRQSNELNGNDTIIIPYRGNWSVNSVYATLYGPLKLTRAKWKIKNLPVQDMIWKVGFKIPYSTRLPVLESSSEPGGDLPDNNNRLGDYYDLKPYHPSDGISRLAWKLFAKSGQLISRQPEPTSTPEGDILMFLIAQTEDDYLAGSTLLYTTMAKNNNVNFTFGCLGMKDMPPANNIAESEKLMIDSSHAADLSAIENDLSNFLSATLNRKKYTALNLFCGEELFTDEKLISRLHSAIDLTIKQGLQPNFFIITKSNHLSPISSGSRWENLAIKFRLLKSLPDNNNPEPVSTLLSSFESECLRKGWRIEKEVYSS